LLAGFRHELESLVRARAQTACDEALHLIGSHHGWARPNWEARAYDRERPAESECAALEAARRFARVQAEWGHWGLAYLEAILKAADGIASEEGKDV
jgi:CRISPR-associated endonuclease/helicase Cas3